MPALKKYKQLKLCIDPFRDHYEDVALSFRLNRQPVHGLLNGTYRDWYFISDSEAFKKQIPSGILFKYSLWTGSVPRKISDLYNGIMEAAYKAGYDVEEKEEAG